ncbi:MAG: ammonia-forming cytochrome c nitrite reductase subunit c552 [Desulfobacteraceae bacterium]|nr:MAG: ammonia-forming cytochrome c nitrite reductase subunit c552 [Desulfobacteraceae bacterium]
MKKKRTIWTGVGLGILLTIGIMVSGCAEKEPVTVQTVQIPEGEIDPVVWGKAYPVEYDLWRQTEEPTQDGLSKYKRTGFDADRPTVDKLSKFPYMALLFSGWGFGVEYNEPRGHAHMVRDQLAIDSARLKSGGVCLTCKSPYAPKLEQDLGVDYYKQPFKQVLSQIPEEHKTLAVACVDCHDANGMSLKISREFTLGRALQDMGIKRNDLTHQQMRSVVCAQCHVTYNIPKNEQNESVGVFFPWQNSKWGNITIEDIIRTIRRHPEVKEWTQKVTGFKMAFIRHPEFELFSNNSVHWKANASCADCHMPYTKVGVYKVSDHRVRSPLDNQLRACGQCHAEGAEWLQERVFAIQDRTVSLMLRSGYATASTAKLFEMVHQARDGGKPVDEEMYNKAKEFYEEAFYRSVFIGAENSVGFHNAPEALRVLGDAIAFAVKSESFLRQILAKAGVDVPLKVDLELKKYIDMRGEHKLMRDPELEIKDPMNLQEMF